MNWLLSLLAAVLQLQPALAQDARSLYCGNDNCYDLLGLQRGAELTDIKKSYRKLALKWHPDKNRDRQAPEQFRKISRAHEVLSDEKLQAAYHYFLDHPEDRYTNYYRYYTAVYAPQTPLWMVISGALLFLSGLQYVNQQWRYSSLMRAVKYQPQFKRRVNELFEAEVAAMKGKLNKLERELLKDKVEMEVIDTQVQLSGSSSRTPSLSSLVGVKALMLPYSLSISCYETCRWYWRFNIQGEAYGPEERAYLTRRVLGITEGYWDQLPEEQQEDFVSKQLWQGDKARAFFAEMQEEQQQKMSQSAAYRRHKRLQRKQ